jgi:DNA-binding NtrC family response regulator
VASAGGNPVTKGMRILVVDDDAVVLASCRRILGAEGHQVTSSSSVREALEILERQEFDLLLVDVIMPEYDGIQLIGKVRQNRATMPILVMSGYPTPETISSGLRMGATHFIAKPFTPQELIAAVNKAAEPSPEG